LHDLNFAAGVKFQFASQQATWNVRSEMFNVTMLHYSNSGQ